MSHIICNANAKVFTLKVCYDVDSQVENHLKQIDPITVAFPLNIIYYGMVFDLMSLFVTNT